MRILLISTNYLPKIGGLEIVVDHLSRYLVTQGHQVTLVTSRSGARWYGVEVHNGIEVHRTYLGVPGSGWKSSLVFPLLAPATLIRLQRLVHRVQPDLINLHFVDNATAYALALARWFDLPLVVSLHGADVEYFPQKRVVYRWLLHKALTDAAAVTACSSTLLRAAGVEHSPGGRSVEAIPNGVDVDVFSNAEPYSSGQSYILAVSRLVHGKGVDVVIRGFAQIPAEFEVELWIAGDGPVRRELEKLARDLGVGSRVRFLGTVPYDTVPSLIVGCEMLVLGSRQESFGVVLLEAMAAAKPVVATAVGGIPELVTDGENGLLVPSESPEALGEAVARLLQDAHLRRAIGQQGQQLVRARYTWDEQGEHFLDLYRRVVEQQRATAAKN